VWAFGRRTFSGPAVLCTSGCLHGSTVVATLAHELSLSCCLGNPLCCRRHCRALWTFGRRTFSRLAVLCMVGCPYGLTVVSALAHGLSVSCCLGNPLCCHRLCCLLWAFGRRTFSRPAVLCTAGCLYGLNVVATLAHGLSLSRCLGNPLCCLRHSRALWTFGRRTFSRPAVLCTVGCLHGSTVVATLAHELSLTSVCRQIPRRCAADSRRLCPIDVARTALTLLPYRNVLA
jgi:hypothetical protein